ncbi:MFS transporter [Novosphingobium humi]|uniref:MFS transporter n=1 Tax=Novosphingobium humi TaxID=2282397 RepID=UPI0025AF4000|nr:MFS transporter [Novosphingobium humi]WJS98526.1 MFS transporter [Novosphingobium humi]
MSGKPKLGWAGLCNVSFGFFGIQIGFALQNANMSRVFQSLGSSIDDLPALWIAAPLTGLLVQPVIGHLSDRTWLGRLGRRRPYFLAGAVLACLALLVMPLQGALLGAAMLLWLLDASLNVAMEPFRAFVGDMLDKSQHTAGYAVQTAFIGAGAVVGSLFPSLLDALGVANVAPTGQIPDTVRYSFWAGGAILLAAVLWTVLNTQEYSPAQMDAFGEAPAPETGPDLALAARSPVGALPWIGTGGVLAACVAHWALAKELYLLGGLMAAYGAALIAAILLARAGRTTLLSSVVGDFAGMPPLMKRLALVQFFSWSALFIMWIYTTPIVAQYHFGATDPASPAYQAAANYVGRLFSIYNGVAAPAALIVLPWLARRIGKARTHAVSLIAGAAGFGSYLVLRDPAWLMLSEVAIGLAWASILAMPYAMLASSLPQSKLGVSMGLFNVFVVVPQLLVATVMHTIMDAFFPGAPVWTMAFAAATLMVAAMATLTLPKVE